MFIDAVNKSDIAFSKGDISKVQIRCEQYRTEIGFKKDYYIETVLDYIKPKATPSLL